MTGEYLQVIVTPAMSLTSFAKTVDALLRIQYQTDLATFIEFHRDKGKSYRDIAAALSDLTGGTVDVTRTTIANWADDVLKVAS